MVKYGSSSKDTYDSILPHLQQDTRKATTVKEGGLRHTTVAQKLEKPCVPPPASPTVHAQLAGPHMPKIIQFSVHSEQSLVSNLTTVKPPTSVMSPPSTRSTPESARQLYSTRKVTRNRYSETHEYFVPRIFRPTSILSKTSEGSTGEKVPDCSKKIDR